MYLNKVVLHMFCIVFLWILITSIMAFIGAPTYTYTPYLYYTTMLFFLNLILVKEQDL
jgi:hypothetical protein